MQTLIKGIAYYLPERILTNEELGAEFPEWKMDLIESKSGVKERHIARPQETALDLAYEACLKLFHKNPSLSGLVDGIIFCTQTPDYPLPGNACILQERLKLSQNIISLDINSACAGYLHGLGVAEGFLSKGRLKNIILITADTYSKLIHSRDRSARVLFGDGAAVTWLTMNEDPHSNQGIVDIQFGSYGKAHQKFYIPGGGCREPYDPEMSKIVVDPHGNARTKTNIHMDGTGILMFVNSVIPQQINIFLKKCGLSIADIDYFVFHQGSQMTLDAITKILKLDEDKVANNLALIGNTVSASIPIALQDAFDRKRLRGGERVILCGFGAGISWGTALVNF